MVEKNSKTNRKRLPKGQRKHNRRVKQAARKENVLNTNPGGGLRP